MLNDVKITPAARRTRVLFNRCILPAIFLITLGAGNLGVGLYKEDQYQQVVDDLSKETVIQHLDNASPLTRIRLGEEKARRLDQRRKQALARVDFYRMVVFGGKIFIALSLPFFVYAALERLSLKHA